MPLYLAIMARVHDEEKRSALLKYLEIVNFRVYILPSVTKRTDTGQGTLFGLAYALFHCKERSRFRWGKEVFPDYYVGLQEILTRFVNEYCTIDVFVSSLTLDWGEQFNYYNWNGIKFFLSQYEQYLNPSRTIDPTDILIDLKRAKLPDDSYSIEHIWAEANRPGLNRESDVGIMKMRLGNMLLLELNINRKAKAKDIAEKIETDELYPSSVLKQVKNVKSLHRKAVNKSSKAYPTMCKNRMKVYHAAIMDERETDMLKFALSRWGLTSDKNAVVRVKSADAFIRKANGQLPANLRRKDAKQYELKTRSDSRE